MKTYLRENSIHVFDFTGRRVKRGCIRYKKLEQHDINVVKKLVYEYKYKLTQICDDYLIETETKYDLCYLIDRAECQYAVITEDVHKYDEVKSKFLELLTSKNYDNVIIIK